MIRKQQQNPRANPPTAGIVKYSKTTAKQGPEERAQYVPYDSKTTNNTGVQGKAD